MTAFSALAAIIPIATSAISSHNQKLEEARQKAAEMAEAYKQQQSSLDSQIEKYKELKESLDKGNLSTDEARSIKEQLLEIQDSLIESYGNEASNIDLVNGKYKEQLGLLRELTKEKAEAFVTEHRDDFETAKKELEKVRTYKLGSIIPGVDDAKNDLVDYLKTYSELLDIQRTSPGEISISVKANAEEADELMHQLSKDLESWAADNDISGEIIEPLQLGISKYAGKTMTDELKEYKTVYDEFMKAEIVRNDTMRPLYLQSIKAVEEYNKALSSGEGVAEAKANLDEIQEAVQDAVGGLDKELYSNLAEGSQDIFSDIYDGINRSAEAAYEFNMAFEDNSSVREYAEQLRGLSDIDLKDIRLDNDNIEKGEEAFASLLETLGYTDPTVEQIQKVIDKLVELGYVTGEVQPPVTDDNPISKTFDQAWADSFTSEIESVKKLGDTLLDLAEKGRLTIDTFNEADSANYFKKLGISAEEAVLKINALVDESKQLSSMSSQVSKISEALATKRDDKFVDADTLSGFDAEIRGLDSWDRFQEVLGSTASSYKECEKAANALATEWVNNSDFLSQLTEQNKEYYATQLKAMGIENYEEIIAYAKNLNAAKEALSQASFDLATATSEEIQELIGDRKYTELAEQQIWALILAKQTAEGVRLDTSTDCLNLLALARNAGITGDAITLLTELVETYDDIASGVYGTNSEVVADAARKAEEIKKKIISIMSDNSDETVELKPRIKLSPKAKSAAKSAGKETGKSYLDGLKEELSKMNSIISYISKLLGKKITSYGNQKDDAVKALEAQKDAAKKALEAQKDAASEAAEAQKDALDSQKEGLESQKEAVQDQIDAKQKEIDKINEAAKARKNELDIQKAQYDLARMQNQKTKLVYSEGKGMHYVTDTSGIRDAKEKITEAKENKVIASIEKEISVLEEAIDAIDKQIDALERQADAIEEQASAASDYYDSLMDESDSYYDQLIADTESYWDSLINGLEEYQTRWEELADIEEEAKMNAALKELGITTEDVLNMSEEEFEKFKERYLAVLTEMYAGDEAVLAALQEVSGVSADSLQTLIKELQKTLEKTDEYSKSADNAETESSELSGELDNASASAGNASSSIDSVSTSASNAAMSIDRLKRSLSNIPSPEGFDAIAAAIERIKDAVDSVCRSVAAATGQMQNLQAFKDAVKIGEGVAAAFSSSGTTVGDSYASGTGLSGLEHDEKNALRSEYGQPELTVYPDGRTELTTSPVMSDLPKGTVVYNEEQTEKIMGSKPAPAGNAYSGGTGSTGGNVIITPGGLELRPLQPGDKMYDMVQKFNKYFDSIDRNIEKLVPNSVYEHNRKMDRIINQISNSSVVNNRNVQQPVTIEIGDIHLTGVQDVDGLAAAIKTRFPNNMMQEYYKN